MMKKVILISVLLICVILLSSCSLKDKITYGGSGEISLPKGEKLVDISWQTNPRKLWILTTERNDNEEPQTYYFRQCGDSGGLTIKEH